MGKTHRAMLLIVVKVWLFVETEGEQTNVYLVTAIFITGNFIRSEMQLLEISVPRNFSDMK